MTAKRRAPRPDACPVAVWFHRSFGRNPDFQPGPFVLPDDLNPPLAEQADQPTAPLQAAFEARLADARRKASHDDIQRHIHRATEAAKKVSIDEAATRQIIDLQLIEAGWEADTVVLTHARGGAA